MEDTIGEPLYLSIQFGSPSSYIDRFRLVYPWKGKKDILKLFSLLTKVTIKVLHWLCYGYFIIFNFTNTGIVHSYKVYVCEPNPSYTAYICSDKQTVR